MNRKLIRQAAVECDQLIEQMVSGSRDGGQLWTLTSGTLARAAATLHSVAAVPTAAAPEPVPVPVSEPAARLEFEVTGGNLTQLREHAEKTVAGFADGRPYLFDLAAYPAARTGDGRIVTWRADITASIYEQETQP
jgi:hypothetical protein